MIRKTTIQAVRKQHSRTCYVTSYKLERGNKKLLETTCDSAKDIGIPGFDKLFGKDYGMFRKSMWGVAILAALAGCIFQTVLRIETFLDIPVTVSVIVKQAKIFQFPAATICPFEPFTYDKKINQLRRRHANVTYGVNVDDLNVTIHFLDLLELKNVNANTLWKIGRIGKENVDNYTHVMCEATSKKNCHLTVEFQEVKTYSGTCLTVKLSDVVEYDGNYNGFAVAISNYTSQNVSYWKYTIVLHESRFLPTPEMLFADVGQRVHPNYETTVTFGIKQYQRVNTPNHPCYSAEEAHQCKTSCVQKNIASNITCRLPFLATVNLPLCTSPEAAKNTYEMARIVYDKIDILCDYCPIPCNETHYSMIQNTIKIVDNWAKGINRIYLKVHLAERFIEQIIEHTPYTFGSLISDLGGSLGLFLGASVLTGLQVLEFLTGTLIDIKNNAVARWK